MATAVDKRGLGIAAGYLLVGLGSAFLSIALAALLAVASMVFLLLPICSSYARSRLKECSSISPVLVSIVGTACSLAIIMAAMMLYGKERDALRKTAAERARVKKESELVQKAMKDAEAKLAVNDIAGAIGVLAEAEDAKDGDGFDKLETHLDNCKKAASDEFFRSTVISMGDAEFEAFFLSRGNETRFFEDEKLNAAFTKRLLGLKGKASAIRKDEKERMASESERQARQAEQDRIAREEAEKAQREKEKAETKERTKRALEPAAKTFADTVGFKIGLREPDAKRFFTNLVLQQGPDKAVTIVERMEVIHAVNPKLLRWTFSSASEEHFKKLMTASALNDEFPDSTDVRVLFAVYAAYSERE